MKYPTLFILVILLNATSCNEINIDDLQGKWSHLPTNNLNPEFSEIIVRNNTIELISDDLYMEFGKVALDGNTLQVTMYRDDLKWYNQIIHLSKDSLVFSDSTIFLRNSYLSNRDFESYDLIGISTDQLLPKVENNYKMIHYYKSQNNEVKIRFGDRMSPLSDLPLFLENGHERRRNEVIVFLGKGITLKDLRPLYIILVANNGFKVTLATQRRGYSYTEVFTDRIDIWWDDMEEYNRLKSPLRPPSPPRPKWGSKQTYLGENGTEIIIDSIDDIVKLKLIQKDISYVIVINKNMSIEQYIEIKRKMKDIRKFNKEVWASIE